MRGLIFLALLTIAALWWGGQHLYVALSDRDPLEITCADYVKDRPTARWLRLTKCGADFDNIAYESDRSGTPKTAYVPLRPEGVESGPTHIVVKREDQDILDVIAIGNVAGAKTPSVQRVSASLAEPTEGLVLFGIDLSDKDKAQLQNLKLGLADDFVIIDRNAKPRLMLALGIFVAGLAGLGLFAGGVIKRVR